MTGAGVVDVVGVSRAKEKGEEVLTLTNQK